MLESTKIRENVYRILNAGCDCYLVDGSHPVLIDTGCCKEDIRSFCEKLIGKTVDSCIITHSHIDHSGKCGLFDHVYMTYKTSLTAKNWMDEDPAVLNLVYEPEFVQDKDVLFEQFEIVECNCHAPGNIMILDRVNKVLFTGDEIDQDQVLLLPGFSELEGQYHSEKAATVHQYQSMLKGLLKYENQVDVLCTGHNGSPLAFNTISLMIDLCEDILNGAKGSEDCASDSYPATMTHFPYPTAHYLRYRKNGLSLVYCVDDLYRQANNNQVEPATPLHRMCEENNHKQGNCGILVTEEK